MDDFVDGASFLCFNLEFKAVDSRRIVCDCAEDHNQDIEPKWIRPQSSSFEFRQTTGSVIGGLSFATDVRFTPGFGTR